MANGPPQSPIPFACPHCGTFTEVAARYKGQTGPCAACGKPITIPHSPAALGPSRSSLSRVPSLLVVVGIGLLTVVSGGLLLLIIGINVLKPDLVSVSESPRQKECRTNLRQIGAALRAYAEAHGSFPPAVVLGPDGQPMHSWRVLILPYLGHQALYNDYDMTAPWDSPQNLQLRHRMPNVYSCPLDPTAATFETSYLLIQGEDYVFNGAVKRQVSDIKDGLATTLLVVETTGLNVNWMEPHDLQGTQIIWTMNAESRGLGSFHAERRRACGDG